MNPYRPWRVACFAMTLLVMLGLLGVIVMVAYPG